MALGTTITPNRYVVRTSVLTVCCLVDKLHSDVTGISTSLSSYEDNINALKQQLSSTCASLRDSFSNSISSLSSEIKAIKEKVTIPSVEKCTHNVQNSGTFPASSAAGGRQTSIIDRSANLVFFGLPEMSMAETRKLVDEISVFLIGSAPGIKDLFRIGKKLDQAQTQSGYKRPTLVKFSTVWDKRLILTAKAKLKAFRLGKIFVRKDMSKEERLAASLSRKARLSSTPSLTTPAENQPVSVVQGLINSCQASASTD